MPGVEASTGALGHGLPIGVGRAMGLRMRSIDARVFVVTGDGEINEGSVWESALAAKKHRLSNLTVMIDYNKVQSAGPTSEILDLEPLADKWRAFGFAVAEVDGHDVAALRRMLREVPFAADRPSLLICHTVKGKGLAFAENDANWHHKSSIKQDLVEQMYAALEQLLMRPTCVNQVFELAKRDPRVAYIGSDLDPPLTKRMREEMPGRAFMEGVSEQHVVGMAAGLAMEGFIPFVHTIATFITRRCFEQVAVDLCLHNLPVRLIGNGGGLVYAPLGPTHLAIEDIAIMRALPNMTVVAVCDADEMKRFMDQTLDWPGPIYIRLAKGFDPIVSRPELGFSIGRAIAMREAAAPRDHVLMIATGVATTRALAAAEMLAEEGIESTVLHMHTVKPLDVEAVRRHADAARLVVTIEEHTVMGGLGSAVVDALIDGEGGRIPPIKRLGIPDTFAHHYGSQDDLMEIYGLQPPQIAQTVRQGLGRSGGDAWRKPVILAG